MPWPPMCRALQLQDPERDAVDVQHDVGPLVVRTGVGCLDRDLFGDGEAVLLRRLPVDEPDRLCLGSPRHPSSPSRRSAKIVDGAVAVIQAQAGVARDLDHFGDGAAHELVSPSRARQSPDTPEEEVLELTLDEDVAVVVVRSGCRGAHSQAHRRTASRPRRCVRLSFIADAAHTRRVLPVSSSCIMPCLSRRVLSRRAVRGQVRRPCRIRAAAIAYCSASGGGLNLRTESAPVDCRLPPAESGEPSESALADRTQSVRKPGRVHAGMGEMC